MKKFGFLFLALAFLSGTLTLPAFAQEGNDKTGAPSSGASGTTGKSGSGQSKQKKKRRRNKKKKTA